VTEQVKDEISDATGFAHEVLEQVETGSAIVVESDDLSINGCVMRQFAQASAM
jgi:hypothetical protein